MGMLKQAKFYLPEACLKTLYSRIVELYFRYFCSVWGTVGVTEKNCLQNFQERAAGIFTNSKFDTFSRPLIERLGWKAIEELIADKSKAIVYKSLYGSVPQ